jgi:hypothetical protein
MGSIVKTIGQEKKTLPADGFENYLAPGELTATQSVPGPGEFFSTIKNRKNIVDLSADGNVQMGINRIMTQECFEISDEIAGERVRVYGVAGDKYDQVRLVGQWGSANTEYGPRVQIRDNSDTESYMEITFYGTDLNLLMLIDNLDRSMLYSVDGGAETTIGYPAGASAVLASRRYGPNQVQPLNLNLPLGIHTIKIRFVGSSNGNIYGFETVTEASQLRVNPATAYMQGDEVSIPETLTSYNSGFTNEYGVSGIKGGNVLVYADADGVVHKDIQWTDATEQTLTAADHSNEELIRRYYTRDFGTGRSDDFSFIFNTVTTGVSFTLSDGTSVLTGNHVSTDYSIGGSPSFFMDINFVGTGLDLVGFDNGANDDNVAIGSITLNGTNIGSWRRRRGLQAICSGLPYGQHHIRINSSVGGFGEGFTGFQVYGPKKPKLPENCIELAQYYLMADYNKVSLSAPGSVSTRKNSKISGLLLKSNQREMTYTGSYGNMSLDANSISGWRTNPTSVGSNSKVSYTFFGTGLITTIIPTGTGNRQFTVSIDGSLNDTGTFIVGDGATNDGGGQYSLTTTTTSDILEFTGLPLGLHTITIDDTASAGLLYFTGFEIITPIHAIKDQPGNVQNSLEVGSQGISDNRVVKPVKKSDVNWTKSLGVSGSMATGSTSPRPISGMNCKIKTTGNPIEISYSCNVTAQSTNEVSIRGYLNGEEVLNRKWMQEQAGNYDNTIADSIIIPVEAGYHTIQLYGWGSSSTSNFMERNLTVRELK